MKWFSSIILIIILLVGLWLFFSREQESEVVIGGDRDEHGCLIAAGYSFNDNVGACVRQFEMTPGIEGAARIAVTYIGKGYALTIVSFNSYEEPGAYDIMFERRMERKVETVYIRNGEVIPAPSHEKAEVIAFQFMQDVVAVASPEVDSVAAERIYRILSSAARTEVSEEFLPRDIALFVKIKDVPDQGVSVEDLQVVSESEVYLVVGLNYSGGRELRNIHLVVEDGDWKVEKVSIP